MADFKISYLKTNKHEGGYSNDPDDSGGETYAGITRKNFPHWMGWVIVDANKPLKQGQRIQNPILDSRVFDFYLENFWLPAGGNTIEDQTLADQVYDMAVNSSVDEALQLLKAS